MLVRHPPNEPYVHLLSISLWEEELLDAGRNLLGCLHDGLRMNAYQLFSSFQGAAVHKYPLHIRRLTIKNNLTDPLKTRGKVDRTRIQDNQICFFPGGQRSDLFVHIE